MNPIAKVKRLFINQPYLALFPISEKSEAERSQLLENFNTCDVNQKTETTELLNTIYDYAKAKVIFSKIDQSSIERNLKKSYFTKKIKEKDKETGEKEVKKITKKRRGSERIIERFTKLKKNSETKVSSYEDLLAALENGSLTEKHIPLLDELLSEHKYKGWIYKVLIIIVISTPIIVFALAKIFNL